jgi:hypothetical protein
MKNMKSIREPKVLGSFEFMTVLLGMLGMPLAMHLLGHFIA